MKNKLPQNALKELSIYVQREEHPEIFEMYVKLWCNSTIIRAQLTQWSEKDRKALALPSDTRDDWERYAFERFMGRSKVVIVCGGTVLGGTKLIACEVTEKFGIEPSTKDLDRIRRAVAANCRREDAKNVGVRK